eukprot:3062162-Prymnesium_polylepis.1
MEDFVKDTNRTIRPVERFSAVRARGMPWTRASPRAAEGAAAAAGRARPSALPRFRSATFWEGDHSWRHRAHDPLCIPN